VEGSNSCVLRLRLRAQTCMFRCPSCMVHICWNRLSNKALWARSPIDLPSTYFTNPLNTNSIANFHCIPAMLTNRHYSTDSFVTAHQGKLTFHRPFSIAYVKVRMTDATIFQFNQALSWSKLGGLLDRVVGLYYIGL